MSYRLRVCCSPHFKPGLLQRTAAPTQQVNSSPQWFRHHVYVTRESSNSWPSLIANGRHDEDAVAGIFRNNPALF